MGSHEKDPSSPKKALSRSNSTVSSKHSSIQQGSESWEVVEEPRARGSPGREPERQEGYLLKKRKWPLKGWHKRYFVLENGILKYATTRQDVLKGKLHGAIDVRQSVMSVNKKAQRVDLDTEENIYHLKEDPHHRTGSVDTDRALRQCPCPVCPRQLQGQGGCMAERQRGTGALLGRAVSVPGAAAGADGDAAEPRIPAPHPLRAPHLQHSALSCHGEAQEGSEDHQDVVHSELRQG